MAGVDVEQLIRQMETVADKLETCDDTGGLARMIRTWVVCVQQLDKEDCEAEEYKQVKEALEFALKDGGGYKPLNP